MRRPPLIASGLTLAAVIVLCALGSWQIKRLQWKQGILTAIEAEYSRSADNLSMQPAELTDELSYRRATLKGVYDYQKQLALGPRTYIGKPGHHIMTPLILRDGSALLVNRGWVPYGHELRLKKPESVTVTGMLRKPPQRNFFTPENNPAQGVWHHPDLEQIAVALHVKLRPFIFYLEEDTAAAQTYPVAAATRINLPNNHLQYAVFWFTMAVVLLIVFWIRFMKPAR